MTSLLRNLLTAFTFAGGMALAPPVMAQEDPQSLAEIARALESIRSNTKVASVGFALVNENRTLMASATGVVSWESRRPVSGDNVFKVGSVTKAFTGLALLKAEQRGLLSLKDPIKDFGSDGFYSNPWSDEVDITLAMLMEHSAGLTDMSGKEFDHQVPAPASLATALAFHPESKTARWRPGEHYSYSNSGAGLAGHALEVASGRGFDEFLKTEVLDPMGMTHASTLKTAHVEAMLAQGYDRDHRSAIDYWHIIFRPAGALNASPPDMARFVRLLLGNGEIDGKRLFSSRSIQRMETPTTTLAARAGLRYGYGLGVYARSHRGHVLYGHGGDGDGYLAQFAYSRESGRGYFLVITAFDYRPLRRMQRVLDDYLVKGLTPPPAASNVDLAEEDVSRWIGHYRPVTWRFGNAPSNDSLQLLFGADGLKTRDHKDTLARLIPVSALSFRRADERVATTMLVTGSQGQSIIQGPMGNFVLVPEGASHTAPTVE